MEVMNHLNYLVTSKSFVFLQRLDTSQLEYGITLQADRPGMYFTLNNKLRLIQRINRAASMSLVGKIVPEPPEA